jgi:hypothetical protein
MDLQATWHKIVKTFLCILQPKDTNSRMIYNRVISLTKSQHQDTHVETNRSNRIEGNLPMKEMRAAKI